MDTSVEIEKDEDKEKQVAEARSAIKIAASRRSVASGVSLRSQTSQSQARRRRREQDEKEAEVAHGGEGDGGESEDDETNDDGEGETRKSPEHRKSKKKGRKRQLWADFKNGLKYCWSVLKVLLAHPTWRMRKRQATVLTACLCQMANMMTVFMASTTPNTVYTKVYALSPGEVYLEEVMFFFDVTLCFAGYSVRCLTESEPRPRLAVEALIVIRA